MKLHVIDQDEECALLADTNCRKCFGRGHVGLNIDTMELIPCKCVRMVKHSGDTKETPMAQA